MTSVSIGTYRYLGLDQEDKRYFLVCFDPEDPRGNLLQISVYRHILTAQKMWIFMTNITYFHYTYVLWYERRPLEYTVFLVLAEEWLNQFRLCFEPEFYDDWIERVLWPT